MEGVMAKPFIASIEGLQCPKCKHFEVHPNGKQLLIRAYKVYSGDKWWSQCLVCSGYYTTDLTVPDVNAKPKGGWF
jgi:hypothetical protein